MPILARRPGPVAPVRTPVRAAAPPPAPAGPPLTKGAGPMAANFAKGGPVLGQRSRFMKVPDPFRTDIERSDYEKKSPGGEMSKTEGDKSETPIKPQG